MLEFPRCPCFMCPNIAALKNAEISGCDAPKSAGISKMFVFWAPKNAEIPGVWGNLNMLDFQDVWVVQLEALDSPTGLFCRAWCQKGGQRALHHDCATLQNHHSTSEPHNNGSERPTKGPRNYFSKLTFL